MIYSRRLEKDIPVTVQKQSYDIPGYRKFTKYTVWDNKIPVGYVDLNDTPKGVHVKYIENMNPQLYTKFGEIADQIEVEHCLNRKMDTFEITSEAALNSHALHYKRGKRFLPEKINEIVKKIIDKTPSTQYYHTKFLGRVKMYMPQELIKKYIEIIKKSPLIK